MFGKIRNLAPVAMLAAFSQTPQGRALIAKAKTYAADPANRRKVMTALTRLTRRP